MLTGEQIRRARLKAGLSQGELAKRLGVSLRSVGNWERGESSPQGKEHAIEDLLFPKGDVVSQTLRSASDGELIAELARRLEIGRDYRQHGTILRTADPYRQRPEAEDPADSAEDELAARREAPHRRRRPGHDPEWEAMYGEDVAAYEPGADMDGIGPDDEPITT